MRGSQETVYDPGSHQFLETAMSNLWEEENVAVESGRSVTADFGILIYLRKS